MKSTLHEYIANINKMMSCPSRVIANLINERPEDLNKFKDFPLREVPRSLQEKIVLLNKIVYHFAGQEVRDEQLLEVLKLHVFEDLEGRVDSVSSALSQLKYDKKTLLQIAELSYQVFKSLNSR